MGVSAANIGKARLQVLMMPNSPFNSIPQQEFAYYFTSDNFSSMSIAPGNQDSTITNLGDSIYAIPDPLNGYRLVEQVDNYNNWLMDTTGTYLEDAVLGNSTTSSSGGTTAGVSTPVDSTATSNAQIALNAMRVPVLNETGQVIGAFPIDPDEISFFTWQVSQNLFCPMGSGGTLTLAASAAAGQIASVTSVANPPPTSFVNAASTRDNTPKWTYNYKERPDGATKQKFLSPFMKTVTPSPTLPVHWGCTMQTALAMNQPFEILFYHNGQVQAIADQAPELTPRFVGLESLTLTKKAYFALETGINNSTYHYLFLFVRGSSPQFYTINQGQATLVSEFTDFSGEKLFDPENAYFPVKVEPVVTSLIVTSPLFDGKEWVIQGVGTAPLFIGEGQLAVYSGNVQAGFALRPVQYKNSGGFATPLAQFVMGVSDERTPDVTAALKGSGDAQQYQSSDGNIYAVDAELFNGQQITSFVAEQANQQTSLPGGQRKITASTTLAPNPNAGAVTPTAGTITNNYYATVKMESSDVTQGNGYMVTNGRSPYIWQLRLELEQAGGGNTPGSGIDISCDVAGCDLNWNATSFNEFNHNGTLKLKNGPGRTFGQDYRAYTNRAIYLQIYAWWEGGVGQPQDPTLLFSGYTTEATVDTKAEIETVTFKIEDYMAALEGCKFVNSPFYDGMKASLAVRDIVLQIGLPDSMILKGDTPIGTSDNDPTEFGLGASLEPLTEPSFRFKDGSSLKSAIVKIATIDGKCVYFDEQGNFHYDPIPGGITLDQNAVPIVNFFSSARDTDNGANVVWNMSSFSRKVNDTYNVLQVWSVSKETGDKITLGDANEPAISNPSAEGYLGYRKHLMVAEPALGSVQAVGNFFDTYRRRVFIPPLTAKFETFGYAGLKPLDCISLDGNNVRIVTLSYRINPPNEFWMNVEGEWFFSQAKWEDPDLNS